MSSLAYSDFSGGNNGGSGGGNSTGGSDGYIASKRKNKTVKTFDGMRPDGGNNGMNSETGGRVNPKLEKLKASIAKIHADSSDDDDGDDNDEPRSGSAATSVLPTYPGQPQSSSKSGLKISPPIADAGSGSGSAAGAAGAAIAATAAGVAPPTTSEGRTHQPMFSMSQQFANRYGADEAAGMEQFKMKAPSTYAAQYYKQYAPYNYNRLSNELSGPGANSDEFIEKLNYIIHMLEEQHSERTEHVMEELVLYCFLGVFIIFIVDSFARAGKYTR
jgi:hypothetical protein